VSLFDTLVDPGDTDAVRTVAGAFAGVERDLHDAVAEHYRALGVDPPDPGPPPEARIEELTELVSHIAAGDLWAYFCAEHAPEGLKNADAARAFAGQSDDEWNESLERLAAAAPDASEGSVRERADAVVRDRFGLALGTFESRVVGWSPEATIRRTLRGRIDADIERIRLATRALEGDET
jgi:hypothetical protein